MQLGFFSFAKLMMLRDLDPENWDEQSLLANKLITGLLADGFELEPPLFRDDDNLDQKLPPERILHVVDADSSQSKVIEEVRSGRNLVVQGPPGTGKSQTITNILAAAAYDNKKVLFVAEKMAALDVVYSRMCKVGLKDLCLELHSRSANKKVFLQGLAETISRSRGVDAPSLDSSDLKKARDELNKVAELLHKPIPQREYTPFSVLSKLVSFVSSNTRAPRFDASELESIGISQESDLFDALKGYLEIVSEHGFVGDNPFNRTTNLDLQPTDLQRLVDDLEAGLEELSGWIDFQTDLEKEISYDPLLTLASAGNCRSIYNNLQRAPESATQFLSIVHQNHSAPRFHSALESATSWISHKSEMSEVVTDSVWTNEIDHLRPALLKGVSSFLSRVFGKYRSAGKELSTYLKGELPKSPEARLKLLDSIIEGKSKKTEFDEETEYLKSKIGDEWRGERTPFSDLQDVNRWFDSTSKDLAEFTAEKLNGLIVKESTKAFSSQDFESRKDRLLTAMRAIGETLGLSDLDSEKIETLSLPELKRRTSLMIEDNDAYFLWVRTEFARSKLVELGCQSLVQMIENQKVSLDSAIAELDYAIAEARWNYARSVKAELNGLSRLDRHALVSTFTTLEVQRVEEVQKAIRERHLSQVPKGSAGEMGIIRGEIAKKRNHRPIRQLMTGAAEMIQRIKPVS